MRVLRLAAALVIAGTLVAPAITPLARNEAEPTAPAPAAESLVPPKPAPAAEAPVEGAPVKRGKPAAKASPAKRPEPKKAKPARSGTASAPAPRTFVWVPVRGADAYEVQFFRGSRRVLLRRTSRPRLEVLTGQARGPGNRFFLAPGAYRWYVWPLFRNASSVRRGDAVVQAKLVVPR